MNVAMRHHDFVIVSEASSRQRPHSAALSGSDPEGPRLCRGMVTPDIARTWRSAFNTASLGEGFTRRYLCKLSAFYAGTTQHPRPADEAHRRERPAGPKITGAALREHGEQPGARQPRGEVGVEGGETRRA